MVTEFNGAAGLRPAVVRPLSDSRSDEPRKPMLIISSTLLALLERAYPVRDEVDMTACQRADFRAVLPTLLRGENPEFAGYLTKLASGTRE